MSKQNDTGTGGGCSDDEFVAFARKFPPDASWGNRAADEGDIVEGSSVTGDLGVSVGGAPVGDDVLATGGSGVAVGGASVGDDVLATGGSGCGAAATVAAAVGRCSADVTIAADGIVVVRTCASSGLEPCLKYRRETSDIMG